MNLTQRQLELFIAAAQTRNLSRAAERCHLSQPAFSRALQALESQLGRQLFERSTRRFEITPDGARLLPLAQRLLEDLQDAVAELHSRGAVLRGVVSLAVGTAFGSSVLPAALQSFMQAHPAVRVRLIDDNSRGITSRVLDGEVDFGIGSVVGPAGGIASEPLLDAPLGLVAHPAAHRLPARPSLRSTTRLPLVKESEDTSIMALLREAGSPWAGAMESGVEVSSLALQLALVRAGIGASIVSALGASHPMAAELVFAPFRPVMRRRVMLLNRRDRPLRPAAQALAACVREATLRSTLHHSVLRSVGCSGTRNE